MNERDKEEAESGRGSSKRHYILRETKFSGFESSQTMAARTSGNRNLEGM
jgi:hypothetical protein